MNEHLDILWTRVRLILAALGGCLAQFLGGLDGLLAALVVFMALDYITGILCAILEKKLSSSVGFAGICKKMFILTLVGMAHVLDRYVAGGGGGIRGCVICFYLSNEGLSLLENAARAGLPIPDQLRSVLSQLHRHQKGDDSSENQQNPPVS